MEYIEKIKKMLCKELDEYAMKSKLTMSDLQPVHLMTDIIKNLDKIEMLEEDSEGDYSEARGGRGRGGRSSYDDDAMYSERRGRGNNAKRDSMGRYSSDDGYSEDYSERYSSDGHMMGAHENGYSRAGAKDYLMRKLGNMMEDADPNDREILKDAMRKIERA
jgi:hypothetical protein